MKINPSKTLRGETERKKKARRNISISLDRINVVRRRAGHGRLTPQTLREKRK